MYEAKRTRMQHRAQGFDPHASVIANVYAFADQRMAEFRQVYSNLVLAAGFEATLDQRGSRQHGKRSDVRDRSFCLDRCGAPGTSKVSVRAAYSITTIQDE